MVTWGDYAITAVRYNTDETRIVKVERREVHSDHLSSASEKSREQIVSSIEAGNDYTTARKNDQDKWELGEEIHPVDVNGETFIRTDQNETAEDNLENLPTF